MNSGIKTKAKQLSARRRFKSIMARLAVVMSGIAVFCVVYVLLAPGLTAEWPLQCELEEHVHDESCYTLVEEAPVEAAQPELICGLEETEGHQHSDDCYTAVRGALLCEDAEHEHTDDCYEWTRELTCGLEETEGHQHGDECWSVPEPTETEAQPEAQYELTCGKEEHTHTEGCYLKPEEKVTYYCGYLTEHTHKEDCYFESGELMCTIPEHIHDDSCLVEHETVALDESFRYETDISTINFHISGEAAYTIAPEAEADVDTESEDEADTSAETGTDAEPAAAGLEFSVALSENQEEYDDYEALVSEDGDVLAMQILHFSLSLDGRELDLSSCEITAELTPTEMVLEYAENGAGIMTLDMDNVTGESEADADMGMLLTASADDGADYAATAVNGENSGSVTVRVSGNTLRTALVAGANPHFIVQYYAYLSRVTQEQPASGTYSKLDVINTDNGGTGTGGRLPYNGTGDTYPYLVNLYVGEDGRLATTTELTKIYKTKEYEYFQAPGLQYFNVVINNTESNYNTFKIWVLKEGRNAESLNEADWDVYDYEPKKTRFTNRPESVQPGNGYILIEDGTVIRLVYKTAEERIEYDARFYDYDISDGYTSATNMNTTKNGINTPVSGSGTQLTFGNGNAGVTTDLSKAHWTDAKGVSNMPNQMNRVNGWGTATVGYGGCTYGLVTGFDPEKNDVIYANGLKSNPLFGNSNSKGKTIEKNINKIGFTRVGDTYTLNNVPGTKVQNLDVFSIYKDKWTNLFWPMDNAATAGAEGHDLMFGGSTPKYYNGSTNKLPESNDIVEHNNYFGMTFGVSFELTKNYVGPLEYYFFGDDDMWVFLEDNNGNIRLICDLGGVHNSVGEYVNLWDYIDRTALEALGKDENGKDQKLTYKLKFFYTERGASGSTCWMQFTLPTVVGIDLDEYLEKQVDETTGALRIEKQLDGVENTQSFEFKLELSDIAADNYIVRGANGELLEGENALAYIGNGDHFRLQAGDVLLIKGLPENASYKITEITTDGYHTNITTSVDDEEIKTEQGIETSGTIRVNAITKVVFTNTASYELPATGGPGTALLYASGAALILLALALMYKQRPRRKGDGTC